MVTAERSTPCDAAVSIWVMHFQPFTWVLFCTDSHCTNPATTAPPYSGCNYPTIAPLNVTTHSVELKLWMCGRNRNNHVSVSVRVPLLYTTTSLHSVFFCHCHIHMRCLTSTKIYSVMLVYSITYQITIYLNLTFGTEGALALIDTQVVHVVW